MTAVPQRIQRKRTKGWKMPEETVYVGRPTVFGNPFTIEKAEYIGYKFDTAETAANFVRQCFSAWLRGSTRDWMGKESEERREAIITRMPELRGKNLACWCSLDQPCHADVLIELANASDGAA